jgi:hypothetical protein
MKAWLLTLVAIASCGAPQIHTETSSKSDWVTEALKQTQPRRDKIHDHQLVLVANKGAGQTTPEGNACFAHLLRGLVVCWPKQMDAQESGNGAPEHSCDEHFELAIAATRPAMARTPGLADRLLRGGAEPNPNELQAYAAGDGPALSCAASAMIWRSILRPDHFPSARSVPVALRLLEHTDVLDPGALYGLAHWTRGTLRALAPVVYGGKLPMAQMDFERARQHGGDMMGFAAALEGRFLCTSLQDERCFNDAASRARRENELEGLVTATRRLLRWVEDRRQLFFLNSPLSKR